MAPRSSLGRLVSGASVVIGTAMAPKATGAVLATSATAAALAGWKPRPMSMTEQIATGRAEPGQRLEQGAEAEGDQHRLDALVVAEAPERALDDREVPAALEQRVDPDRVDDDPHDREEAEGRALGAGIERLTHRHRVDDDRHEDRDQQRPQGGDMSLQLESAQQDEQRDERQRREERRQEQRVADRVEHLLVHAQSPPEERIALSYPGQPQIRPNRPLRRQLAPQGARIALRRAPHDRLRVATHEPVPPRPVDDLEVVGLECLGDARRRSPRAAG